MISTVDRPVVHPELLEEFPALARGGDQPSPRRRRTPRGAWLALAASAAMITGGVVAVDHLDDGPAPVQSEVAPGSLSALAAQLDVPAAWSNGITGAGVNIAMVDTGVAPVEALADQVVVAVDFTDEAADATTAGIDTYGHGTHLAGIVAADDPANGISGLAPGAGIVSVKVAGRDGSVMPLDLIKGIDWVVANADQYDIGVLSLAFNAPTTDPTTEQMLLDAVERAWDAGLVVITAAGNDGGVGLTAPASSRSSIAVAAVEATDFGFEVTDFSSMGDGLRNPDIAVPGKSIQSLRVPGSYADTEHPEGYVDEFRFKGTGTSQSAAAAAALAALVLEANPDLTNDQVRDTLISASTQVGTPEQTGAGVPSALVAIDLVSEGVSWTGQAWSGQAWSGQAWSGQAWSGQAWS
ncbi:MAG: S8 family serine peptidase, partial [Ilumatobacter sp.]|nr:S8 family serine peptidase [Ilumatobacter sp.]